MKYINLFENRPLFKPNIINIKYIINNNIRLKPPDPFQMQRSRRDLCIWSPSEDWEGWEDWSDEDWDDCGGLGGLQGLGELGGWEDWEDCRTGRTGRIENIGRITRIWRIGRIGRGALGALQGRNGRIAYMGGHPSACHHFGRLG